MAEKPSYLTSTFSLVTLIVTLGFVILCVWTKNVDSLKELAMLILGGYSVKKGMEAEKAKNGGTNGQAPVQPAP